MERTSVHLHKHSIDKKLRENNSLFYWLGCKAFFEMERTLAILLTKCSEMERTLFILLNSPDFQKNFFLSSWLTTKIYVKWPTMICSKRKNYLDSIDELGFLQINDYRFCSSDQYRSPMKRKAFSLSILTNQAKWKMKTFSFLLTSRKIKKRHNL
jgi:hypothetical protein